MWPNPALVAIVPIAICAGVYFGFMTNIESRSLAELVGAFAAWIIMVLGYLTYVAIKLAKARKRLRAHSEQYSLPFKGVLKEFKRNHAKVGKALKAA